MVRLQEDLNQYEILKTEEEAGGGEVLESQRNIKEEQLNDMVEKMLIQEPLDSKNVISSQKSPK